MAQYARPPEPRAMTLAEWAALDDEDRRELVGGIPVEEEMPTTVHELVIAWLIGMLHAWARSRGALVLGSGVKLAVARNHGRMPDALVYLRDAGRPQPKGLVDVPPSIAIEVVTATPRDERRDRVEKLYEYASFGVKWYWLVDPEMRTFEVLELGSDGRYVHALAVSEGVVENVPGCEGLGVDVGELWGEVDALVKAAGEG